MKVPEIETSDCPECGDAAEDVGFRTFRCVGPKGCPEFKLPKCPHCAGTIVSIFGKKKCSIGGSSKCKT